MKDVTSKSMEGITDLVVVAPIKDGFIEAYDNITYATRLKLVAEALNKVRVAAREYERSTPFSDVTERILNLLDFRIGVIDQDVFGLARAPDTGGADMELRSRRFLYLTATFEGGWEPYMRLIWKPLGAFLDLLFCNCEGYVTAADHGCEEYLQWVRDNQMDSSIFYAVTGLTTRDAKYLGRLERLERSGAGPIERMKFKMPYPEAEAEQTRKDNPQKTIELGLEALTVLFKLADYYPPEWLTGKTAAKGLVEGHRLVRVAREILSGFEPLVAALLSAEPDHPLAKLAAIYADPLTWFRTGCAHLDRKLPDGAANRPPQPIDPAEVQGGILKPQGTKTAPVRHGALMLFTIRDAAGARRFVKAIDLHFEAGPGSAPASGFYRTIGFTANGLLRMGLPRDTFDRLPKEFREGMAARAGLLGDYRELHPRNWILPARNGPVLTGEVAHEVVLPPVELDEVDFVIQLRTTAADRETVLDEVRRLARAAGKAATLEAYEMLHIDYHEETGQFTDHFGFLDGLSQPRPTAGTKSGGSRPRDAVATGELFCGHANDRGDPPPGPFATLEPDDANGHSHWRAKQRARARKLQHNGTYLVVRKIGEEVTAFDAWLDAQSEQVGHVLGCDAAAAREQLRSALLGRSGNGAPLVTPASSLANDFDYAGDPDGARCPFSAHIRRANPRRVKPRVPGTPLDSATMEFDRPTPRLLRRGMLFGKEEGERRGLMFMAYNASIAEQYEVIQRWLNGGNSTDVASAHNDALTGVTASMIPGEGLASCFRFIARDRQGDEQLVSVPLPSAIAPPGAPRAQHPFTPLHWGLYLLVPARAAIANLVRLKGNYRAMEKPLEEAVGRKWLDTLELLPAQESGKEWKRLLEDIDIKDPAAEGISQHLWGALRWRHGGALNLRGPEGRGPIPPPVGAPLSAKPAATEALACPLHERAEAGNGDRSDHDWSSPDVAKQNVILCAGRKQVRQVLHDWETFSNEEQLRRIAATSGPIFVTQQPDNEYLNPKLHEMGLDYAAESVPTNRILLDCKQDWGFETGYRGGRLVLEGIRKDAAGRPSSKIELRRQYLFPALAEVYRQWYGLPDDGTHAAGKGWDWRRIVEALSGADDPDLVRTAVHCPGDFLSPSRHAFYPRPSATVAAFADNHGPAIRRAGEDYVAAYRARGEVPKARIAHAMFTAIEDDDILARNIIGTMVGAIPPMEANLRGILVEWLLEKSLWRHQSALHRALGGARADTDVEEAMAVLDGPVSQAMCKRPAPDLLFRTAKGRAKIEVDAGAKEAHEAEDVFTREGDLVIVSQVSAAQWSLIDPDRHRPHGDVSIVFGGRRKKANQIAGSDDRYPVHACPAQALALGAMKGLLAALLDAGTIQALPASLIVRISDWRDLPAPPGAPSP